MPLIPYDPKRFQASHESTLLAVIGGTRDERVQRVHQIMHEALLPEQRTVYFDPLQEPRYSDELYDLPLLIYGEGVDIDNCPPVHEERFVVPETNDPLKHLLTSASMAMKGLSTIINLDVNDADEFKQLLDESFLSRFPEEQREAKLALWHKNLGYLDVMVVSV